MQMHATLIVLAASYAAGTSFEQTGTTFRRGTGAGKLPNILFVLADDMGWGDVSYNTERLQPGAGGGNWTVNPPRTPHIDALATNTETMRFSRWYTASDVCSPTRASILTGRSPERSCINGAEGCGQKPAWSCYDDMPLPPTEFTVAEAAKQRGYATLFVGKWHLGDFYVKGERPKNYAQAKWPSSSPGVHGFDEWSGTEASASSSTTNCGCNSAWKLEGAGCIAGGGEWTRTALECTNYWSPMDLDALHVPIDRLSCRNVNMSYRSCVGNLTEKIEGDDSQYMMDVFEEFVQRKSRAPEESPWLAQLSLHTNHVPHPAMPEWFYAYNHTEGGPAGDYLGTISQMDAAIGRMVQILEDTGALENTMLWFSLGDNGAHTAGAGPGGSQVRPSGQLAASNGLRQCKASLFEGGIRVNGFVHWPGVIRQHVNTLHAAVTSDFLPTILDLLNVSHPHPEWASDGMSLLPLLTGDIPPTAPRSKPIGFSAGGQQAWQVDSGADGVWKLIYNGQKGQCDTFLPPYGNMTTGRKGPFLFNLTADPTEDIDLCSKEVARCNSMKVAMQRFVASIDDSRVNESECARGPSWVPPPLVPPERDDGRDGVVDNATGGFRLEVVGSARGHEMSRCLRLSFEGLAGHAAVVLGECDTQWPRDNLWSLRRPAAANAADAAIPDASLVPPSQGHVLYSKGRPDMCLKVHARAQERCADGNTLWFGPCNATVAAYLRLDAKGHLVARGCSTLCTGPATDPHVFAYTSAAVALRGCDSKRGIVFAKRFKARGPVLVQ